MSYFKTLEEYSGDVLLGEIKRRIECQDKSICWYCGRRQSASDPPCRYKTAHAGIFNMRDELRSILEEDE